MRGSKKLLHNRVRNVWIGHKYYKLCTFTEKVGFDAIVDHLALVHILKSKTEPATPRIK